jgi:hypothetical protein
MAEKNKSKKFANSNRKGSRPEIGASGTTNFQGIIDSDEYVTNLQGTTLYTTIDKMRWSDASVQAAILMCELPIRSAEWDIEPASDSPEDTEIAEFVKKNIFEGLIVNWEDTLRQILLMHPYGCMVFEVIYKLTEDGKIGWRKWAPRLPKTIEKWNVDDNGELIGIVQRTYKKDNYKTFEIPIEKLMVFTNRREGDNYLGTSILRQAYKHWFFRDKYYKIDAVAQERSGIGIPVITMPDAFTDDDYDEAEKLGENLRGHEKAYIIKKTGWEVEMLDLKSGTLKDPSTMLDHHTREILKSVLAQFIDLGSKSVGSYSLSKDQSQIFLDSLDSSAKTITEVINQEIRRLVDYNWTVEEYPQLTHSDLGSKDTKELSEAIQALIFAGVLTTDPELEDYVRGVLKLPEKSEEYRQEVEDMQKNARGGGNDEEKNKKEDEDLEEDNKDKGGNRRASEKKPFHRELTKVERRVKFDEIRDFMDNAEAEVKRTLASILTREKTRLMPLFEEAIRNNDFRVLQSISWQLKGQYAQAFREQIKKLFEYGKLKASHEIKMSAPVTDVDQKDRINRRSIYLANYQEKQMLDSIKQIVAESMMIGVISKTESLALVESSFDKFINKNVPAVSALVTSDEINNGRFYTFDSNKEEIYGYQWSAILDGATCNYCQSMDGRVIGVEDKAFSTYKPGAVHFKCRCIWVAILLKGEVDPPPFTGIPEGLRPQSQVPPWDFKDLEYPLPGSGKRKMPYGIGVYKEKKNGKK